MWDVCAKQLRKLELAKTPSEKQKCIGHANIALSSSYSLAFPGKNKQPAADFIVPAMILVLLRANLKDPLAQYKLMKFFGNFSEGAGFEENQRVNFLACNDYILQMTLDDLNLTE